MPNFIYVFSADERDILLSAGYMLVCQLGNKDIYVFENKAELTFANLGVRYALSDTLTF